MAGVWPHGISTVYSLRIQLCLNQLLLEQCIKRYINLKIRSVLSKQLA